MDIFAKTIREYLQSKDLFHSSDDILIEELVFNINMSRMAKEDIETNGIQVDITRDPDKDPFFQKNRAVDVYQQALKNIQSLFRQLTLSPSERQKLRIELSEKTDVFDDIFK